MSRCKRTIAVCALAASVSLAAFAATAGEVQQVSLGSGTTGTRAEIKLTGSGSYQTLTLSSPNRLVVDFAGSSAVRGLRLPAGSGMVSAVRTGQPKPGVFRVVFDLSDRVVAFKPQWQQSGATSTLVIEWPGESNPAPVAAKPPAATANPSTALNAQAEAARATAALAASAQRAAAVSAPMPSSVTGLPAAVPAASAATTAVPVTAPAVAHVSSATVPVVVASAVAVPPAASAATPVRVVANTAPANSPAAILNGGRVVGAAPVAASTPAVVAPPVVAAVPTPRPAMPSDAARIKMSAGMRTLVVAIDPGHGGQDPGAIGPSGKREKDVTLAVARELARQVNATPGLKAYLTRESDVFIPLPMRAKKARAAGADIFISIHADAAENRSATGSSVYVLSTKGASSQRARWLADKENAADLVGGVRLQQTENTLANVLIDLAQSGHMKASEDAAGHVLGGLKQIGNNHKPQLERANFAVLRTSDMPAMLVETAFISNPSEERRLTDPGYQRKLAGAVLEGVNTFFTRQPPPGTLYAARAQAEAVSAVGNVAGGSR
jgi:N-acetylmuramoyl-L-alanine amidase